MENFYKTPNETMKPKESSQRKMCYRRFLNAIRNGTLTIKIKQNTLLYSENLCRVLISFSEGFFIQEN